MAPSVLFSLARMSHPPLPSPPPQKPLFEKKTETHSRCRHVWDLPHSATSQMPRSSPTLFTFRPSVCAHCQFFADGCLSLLATWIHTKKPEFARPGSGLPCTGGRRTCVSGCFGLRWHLFYRMGKMVGGDRLPTWWGFTLQNASGRRRAQRPFCPPPELHLERLGLPCPGPPE